MNNNKVSKIFVNNRRLLAIVILIFALDIGNLLLLEVAVRNILYLIPAIGTIIFQLIVLSAAYKRQDIYLVLFLGLSLLYISYYFILNLFFSGNLSISTISNGEIFYFDGLNITLLFVLGILLYLIKSKFSKYCAYLSFLLAFLSYADVSNINTYFVFIFFITVLFSKFHLIQKMSGESGGRI